MILQPIDYVVYCWLTLALLSDATGIILAAILTALLVLPMWAHLLIEYIAGFLFGLLIFQALFMRATMGGTYWKNVKQLRARVALDEFDDGRDGTGGDMDDDGPQHARHVAGRAAVLVRDVTWHRWDFLLG